MDLTEAITDAVNYSKQYKKEAQFVMSRCNHHIHLSYTKTGVRVPLAGCRSKKGATQAQSSFSFKKEIDANPKSHLSRKCASIRFAPIRSTQRTSNNIGTTTVYVVFRMCASDGNNIPLQYAHGAALQSSAYNSDTRS